MSGLESATYINQLNPLNPDGAADYVSGGDDHMRLLKSTIQSTFPRITGPVPTSQDDLTNSTYLVDSSVTPNVITLTFNPAWSSYVAGKGVMFKANTTNTGATTININGLGTKAIVDSTGNALIIGAIVSGNIYTVTYNGTSFNLTSGTNSVSANNATTSNITTLTTTTSNITTANITTANITNLNFIPAGTKIPFYNTSVPAVGWTLANPGTNYTLVSAATGGTVTAGNGNIVTGCNLIVDHYHTQQGTFTSNTVDVNHTHNYTHQSGTIRIPSGTHSGAFVVDNSNNGSTATGAMASNNLVAVTTTISGPTQYASTTGFATGIWQPAYAKVCIGVKS